MKLGDVDMLCRVVENQQRECSDPFAKKVWDIILEVISICPEIDPETLPIVRQLRAENARLRNEVMRMQKSENPSRRTITFEMEYANFMDASRVEEIAREVLAGLVTKVMEAERIQKEE